MHAGGQRFESVILHTRKRTLTYWKQERATNPNRASSFREGARHKLKYIRILLRKKRVISKGEEKKKGEKGT